LLHTHSNNQIHTDSHNR